MKIVVVYNGKTGFTKRYADWIADEIRCDVKSYNDFLQTPVEAEETVIFGSRLYAGKIEHLKKVKSLVHGQLVVFAVGITPVSAENAIRQIWIDNLSDDEMGKISHFYMQGGLDYKRMGFLDRTLMKLVASLISTKKNNNGESIGFGQIIKRSHDGTSKEYSMPLVEYVKNELLRNERALAISPASRLGSEL